MVKWKKFIFCLLFICILFSINTVQANNVEFPFAEGKDIDKYQMLDLMTDNYLNRFYPAIREDLFSNGKLKYGIYKFPEYTDLNQRDPSIDLSTFHIQDCGIWYDQKVPKYFSAYLKSGLEGKVLIYGYKNGNIEKLMEYRNPIYLNEGQSFVDLKIQKKQNSEYVFTFSYGNIFASLDQDKQSVGLTEYFTEDGNGNIISLNGPTSDPYLNYESLAGFVSTLGENLSLEANYQQFLAYSQARSSIKQESIDNFFQGVDSLEVDDFKKSLVALFPMEEMGIVGKLEEPILPYVLNRLWSDPVAINQGNYMQAPPLLKDSPLISKEYNFQGTALNSKGGKPEITFPRSLMEDYLSNRFGILLENKEYSISDNNGNKIRANVSEETISVSDALGHFHERDILIIEEINPYYNYGFIEAHLLTRRGIYGTDIKWNDNKTLYILAKKKKINNGQFRLKALYTSAAPFTVEDAEKILGKSLKPANLENFNRKEALGQEEESLLKKIKIPLIDPITNKIEEIEEEDRLILSKLWTRLWEKPIEYKLKGNSISLSNEVFTRLQDSRKLPKDLEEFYTENNLEKNRGYTESILFELPSKKRSLEIDFGDITDIDTVPEIVTFIGGDFKLIFRSKDLSNLKGSHFTFLYERNKLPQRAKIKFLNEKKEEVNLPFEFFLIGENQMTGLMEEVDGSDRLEGYRIGEKNVIIYPINRKGSFKFANKEGEIKEFSSRFLSKIGNLDPERIQVTRKTLAQGLGVLQGTRRTNHEIKVLDISKNHPLYKDVVSAIELGQMELNEGIFHSDQILSREQIFTVLSRILYRLNYRNENRNEGILEKYPDHQDVSEENEEMILIALEEGMLLTGGNLDLKDSMSLANFNDCLATLSIQLYSEPVKQKFVVENNKELETVLSGNNNFQSLKENAMEFIKENLLFILTGLAIGVVSIFSFRKRKVKDLDEIKKNCPYCGNEVLVKAKFCPICGKKVRSLFDYFK